MIQNSAISTEPVYERVDVSRFKELIKDSTIIIIDVRTSAEHSDGHITDRDLNLDVMDSSFASRASIMLKPGSKAAIYCRSGNRSKKAAAILTGQGINVYELSSGYNGWIKEN